MAKKPKETAERKVLFSKLKQIWTDLSLTEWLLLVCEILPMAQFTQSGPHIKGRCPFHEDPGPSFIVTPSKGMVKCFGCRASFFNPVHFISALKQRGSGTSCSFGEALMFLRKRFGLKAAIPEALYKRVQEHEAYQRTKGILLEFFCSQLFEAICAYPDRLQEEGLYYAKPAVEYLMTRDLGGYAPNELRPLGEEEENPASVADPYNIWPAITANQLLGVLPPLAAVSNKFGESSEEFKFFSSYFTKFTQDPKAVGNLVFPLHDEPGSVCRFKIRCPSTEKKEFFFVDDAYEAEMDGFRGFYGLHYFRTFLGVQSATNDANYIKTCSVFEGEFDVLAAIAQQIRRGQDDFIVFALGGASVQPLDRLASYGLTNIRIVQDRDGGGDNIVRLCMERTKSEAMQFEIFNWPDEYASWRDPANPDQRVKDPDNAIKALGYPIWARFVNTTDTYFKPTEWCFDQASTEIHKIPTADIRQRNRAAVDWGKLLRNAQECLKFCALIEKHFELDSTHLFREIRARDEDEEAFISRTCEILKEHFHFVGIQNIESRKRLLTVWVKERRVLDSIVLNDEKSIETTLSRYFGTVYDFIRDKVGDPAFMALENDDSSFNVTIRAKKYKEYLNFALLKLANGLPSLDHAQMKAQGLHYISTENGEMHSYMVNGREVFHFVHTRDTFKVTQLDGPRDRDVIFDNAGKEWLHTVKNVDDVTKANVDIVDLYLRVHDIVANSWTFRHPEVDSEFLAAYIMCLPVMTLFTRQTSIMLNAEAESGKSRFTAGLIGGSGFPRINIVAHAVSMSLYTAASIRQLRNNSSLAVSLEEFEDYGTNDPKSLQVRKILELFRDMISEHAISASIGTTSGEAKTFSLRFPLNTSAIRPLRDAASLSRFITFELVKDPKRIDPVISILARYGVEGVNKVRHEVAVGLYPYMYRLRELQEEIEKEFGSGAMMPSHASSRFREALYPILSMMRLINEVAKKREGGTPPNLPDHRRFAYAFAETRKDALERLKTTSENEQIFESILSSAIQIVNPDDSTRMSWVTTLRVMLGDLNKLDDINKTKKGVYFDKMNEWIVVNWIEASQGVLANTKYKTESPSYMKQVSERSPFHVKTEVVRQNNVLSRMADVMGPCHTMELISVFSVKHLLDEARASQKRAMSAAPVPGAETASTANPDQTQKVDDIIA